MLEQMMRSGAGGMGDMGGMGGANPRQQQNVIHLTHDEMEAVQRIMALGFSQQEAGKITGHDIVSYIAIIKILLIIL